MPRTFKVTSSAMPNLAGLPALEFASLSGSEGLSQVFEYHITLVTPDNPMLTDLVTANVDYKPLVGNSFTVTMALDGGGQRHLTGLVTRARFVQSQDRRACTKSSSSLGSRWPVAPATSKSSKTKAPSTSCAKCWVSSGFRWMCAPARTTPAWTSRCNTARPTWPFANAS